MIDVPGVLANSLWILGLALLLAALSFAHCTAREERVRLRVVLRRTAVQRVTSVAWLLFCAGLAATSDALWEQVVWALLGLAWAAQAILAGMAEGVLAVDRLGHVQLVNRAARTMLSIGDEAIDRHYLVRDGKVRHLGVSNFNIKWLKRSQELSETPIITNQVPYRLPDKSYAANGVIEYCQQNDILVTAYSPVKFRSMRVNKRLGDIAEAHSSTPFQIALAWLVMQSRVITIPMSFDSQHVKENLDAADIELTDKEMSQLADEW